MKYVRRHDGATNPHQQFAARPEKVNTTHDEPYRKITYLFTTLTKNIRRYHEKGHLQGIKIKHGKFKAARTQ